MSDQTPDDPKPLQLLPVGDDPIIHTTLPPLPPAAPPILVAPDKPLTGTPVPTAPDVAN